MLISSAVDRTVDVPVDQLLAELKYTIKEFDLFCYTAAAHNKIKVGRLR